MELFIELVNFLVSVGCYQGSGDYDHCAGSAFSAITAALATQGYWQQADILWHVNFTGFQILAIIVYLFACISGIVGMALGSPPKQWLWLLIGPGIFLFLVDTTTPVYGVRWYVGPGTGNVTSTSRQDRAMREVWKLSEAGLVNMALSSPNPSSGIFGLGSGSTMRFFNNAHPEGRNRTLDPADPPDGRVRVSWVFYWIDWVLSDFVEWMIDWTGVFNGGMPRTQLVDSNLPIVDLENSSGLSFLTGAVDDTTRQDDQAWMLSNNKWGYLMDITGAQLHDGDLRDAFVTMMASECGDALGAGINEQAWIAAQHTRGLNLPPSVFTADSNGILYEPAIQELVDTHIPTPAAVGQLLKKRQVGGFGASLAFLRDDNNAEVFYNSGIMETISCDQLLTVVVEGFRWEAAHTYYQLLTSLPADMSPLTLLYTLFYGWDMREEATGVSINWGIFREGGWADDAADVATYLKNPEQQGEFLQNLIFVHLLRNELALAPKPFRGRVSQSEKAIISVEKFQSNNGSRSKFGEIYTWAMMIPYIQGVLLYLIAIAYPFVCMLTMLPGQTKILFTWFSFFAWAKLWDVGFAVVMVLERSIWAMLGNGPNTGRVFSRVRSMENFGDTDIQCLSDGTDPFDFVSSIITGPFGATNGVPYTLCAPGSVPLVTVGANGDTAVPLVLENVLRYFDQALTVGANLQLDLANSYYIYIMSALYFAVPAVTGQAVLGAKAGAAGLATSAIGGIASQAGSAAAQGYVGGQSRIAQQNSGVGQHATKMAAMRAAGLGAAAVESGAAALQQDLRGAAADAENNGIRQVASGFVRGVSGTQGLISAAQGVQRGALGGSYGITQMGGQGLKSGASGSLDIGLNVLGSAGMIGMANGMLVPQPPDPTSGSSSSLASAQSSSFSPDDPSSVGGVGVSSGTPSAQSMDQKIGGNSNSWASPFGAAMSKWQKSQSGQGGNVPQGLHQVGSSALDAAGQVNSGQGAYLSNYANAIGDAMQADAYLTSADAKMQASGFRASADQSAQWADAQSGEHTHNKWKDHAVDMAEHLSAIGGNGASIQGTTQGLATSANAAAAMGYLGAGAKAAAMYRTSGWVETAGGYMAQLGKNYGGGNVMEAWRQGGQQMQAAYDKGVGTFPAISWGMGVAGGHDATRNIQQHLGVEPMSNRSTVVP